MYKLCHDFFGVPSACVIRVLDNAGIPFDPANTDYAEYLRWLDAGNTPLPSDSIASDGVDELTTNQGA